MQSSDIDESRNDGEVLVFRATGQQGGAVARAQLSRSRTVGAMVPASMDEAENAGAAAVPAVGRVEIVAERSGVEQAFDHREPAAGNDAADIGG